MGKSGREKIDDCYKDLVYVGTRDIIKQELADAEKLSKISGVPLTNLPFLLKELDLSLSFGTIDDIFSLDGSSKQPLIYTPNLKHVIELAEDEGREIDLMYGLCLYNNHARMFASNGEHSIGLPPITFKEHSLERGRMSIDDFLKQSLEFLKRPFPGGRPDIGRLEDYNKIDSLLGFEPSLGKALKIFKYFEISQAIKSPLNIWTPTQEYIDEVVSMIGGTPFSKGFVEHETRSVSKRFQRFALEVQKNFYPEILVNCIDSAESKVKSDLEKVIGTQGFKDAVAALGDNSYGVIGWGENTGRKMDEGYSSMFLSSQGRLLIDKDSPSRIIFVHARDLTSFALQSLWIYQQLIKDKDYTWKDRVAVVGVSGAPGFRLLNDSERMRYLKIAHRLSDDDYLANGQTCLFLGDSPKVLERKISEMSPTTKQKDPMYTFVRQLHHFLCPEDKDIMRYIDAYSTSALSKSQRFEEGKQILYSLITDLKAKTGF